MQLDFHHGLLGMIEVCSENYGGRYVGLAQVWISGGHITQAITKLNERFLDPFGSYSTITAVLNGTGFRR